MFSNIGGKIKTLAKIVAWAGIAVSVLAGIAIMNATRTTFSLYGVDVRGGSGLGGALVMVFGSLCSWASSFLLYGFGDLVENMKRAADALDHGEKPTPKAAA